MNLSSSASNSVSISASGSMSKQESLQKIGSNQAADDQNNKEEENKANNAPFPKNGCIMDINDNNNGEDRAAMQRNKLLAA